jgi:hypothetical protein
VLADAINGSLENAAAGILLQGAAEVRTGLRDETNRASSSHTEITAAGEIRGFLALEVWIDRETNAVWTLAAARRPAAGQ